MSTTCYYATECGSPIVSNETESWYYSGSFADGQHRTVLVFTVELLRERPGGHRKETFLISRPVYLTLPPRYQFPVVLRMAGKEIRIVKQLGDWAGFEIQNEE